MLGGGRLVARFEHGIDGDASAFPSVFAQVIVAFESGDPHEPVFERGVAPELAQFEVGLNENVLTDIIDFSRISRKPSRHTKDPSLVTARNLGEGMVVPSECGLHELFIGS
jgi:hypothetical protein